MAAFAAILTGCIPGDSGSEVKVENRCDTVVRFVLGGGRTPAQPETDPDLIDSIEARSTVEYSTLIDQPRGYLRVVPSQQTIAFEISSTVKKAHVVLDRDLCP